MSEHGSEQGDPGLAPAEDAEDAASPTAEAPVSGTASESQRPSQTSAAQYGSAARHGSGTASASATKSLSMQHEVQRTAAKESASAASAREPAKELFKDESTVGGSKTESRVSAASASTMASARNAAPVGAAKTKSGNLKAAASIITRLTLSAGSMLSGRAARSRSAMSVPSSRASLASRSSRGTAVFDYGLSPGLQELIERLAATKDVGLIAYLSAIPGEPHRATRPPAAVAKLHRKQSVRPKSIMKISKPQVRFEPTYRLEPVRPFRTDAARALVQAALEKGTAGASYSDGWATDACRILAAYITQCVKGLEAQGPGSRYKIGTMVSVLERRHQGVFTEVAVLWDAALDRILTASVETTTMVAYAVVYAVFWE